MRNRVLGGIGAMAVLVAVAAADLASGEESTREVMRDIFAELRILLPAAVQRNFGDPDNAATIRRSLRGLERRAEALDGHTSGLDPGARLFGQALAHDAQRALRFFERGKFENAEFYVESLVDDCVACHTRLPAVDSPWAQGFLEQREFENLDPLERATVLVATRRFETALKTYEQILLSPDESPELLLGPLSSYLSVALRVQRDPVRPRAVLANLAERGQPSSTPREDLVFWSERLKTLEVGDLRGTTLERARNSVEAAETVARYPGDPRALIEFLGASSQLYQLLQKPQSSPVEVGEIYFLLGRAELGIGRGAWLPRADLFLETAIRMAPGSPVARDAYALLEEETHAGYTGSGGLRLPPEEQARLSGLRTLSEGDAIDATKNLDLAESGRRLFANHCAACHGFDAQGRGPLSGTLMTLPKDLTQIAQRRDGKFPSAEIRALIDGRDPLANHRSPEMPRWGEFWSEPRKLDAVVAYLRGIQR